MLGIALSFLSVSVGFANSLLPTPNAPLELTIKTNKNIYQVGEKIEIKFIFKNISNDAVGLLVSGNSRLPRILDFEFGRDTEWRSKKPVIELDPLSDTEEIQPGREFAAKVLLNQWKSCFYSNG